MAFLQRMIRFSKSTSSSPINPCNFFSSNSPAHRLNYGRISQPSIKSYTSSSNSWKYPPSISRITDIVKPDGNGRYYVDRICLKQTCKDLLNKLRSLDDECKTAENYRISSEAKKKLAQESPYPWLKLEEHKKVVGGRYEHIKDYWDANQFLDTAEREAYYEATQFDMTKLVLSMSALGLGSIWLATRF